ncbi:hypothetical protein D9M68_861870 [compost metagenome]
MSSKILAKRSKSLLEKAFLSTKKPNKRIKINKIGGSAKLAKKAVAPAKRKGSFFWNNLKAMPRCLKNNVVLVIALMYILIIYSFQN